MSVEQMVVVFRRGRVNASRPVRSAEGLVLSHEARPTGSTNTVGTLNKERGPSTFLTTEEARACSWEGWRSESVGEARERDGWTGELADLDLALLSQEEKRCIL